MAIKKQVGEGRLRLFLEIEQKLQEAAKDAFDPETALDSNGYDQGVREGILQSIDIVRNVVIEP